MTERILVAMSGGVDSSVAAALLKEEGRDVVGVFMRNGVKHDAKDRGKPNKQGCCSIEDSRDAGAVAAMLGVPFYALNFEDEFEQIVNYFVDEYLKGRTPNPCVVCNNRLKFGHVLRYADDIGAASVATGHYARTVHRDGRYRLLRAKDRAKDQTYYLFGLTQAQLARCTFPLGEMTKREVREHAARFGLCTRDKPESQEICFVPNNDYRTLIEQRVPQAFKEGPIVDRAGNRLGTHRGTPAYTIGQRRGLGLGGGTPYYVTALEPTTNTVVVGDEADVQREDAVIARPNFIGIEAPRPKQAFRADVQIRYRHTPVPATLTMLIDGSLRVVFDTPQTAVTPGQAAVFYTGDECLGGGFLA